MIDTTVLLSFFYALCCSRQFISVVGGFLLACPLTAHLYVAPTLANLFPVQLRSLYLVWMEEGLHLRGGRIAWAAFSDAAAQR